MSAARKHIESPTPFNPLDKQNLGTSVAEALLAEDVGPLPPVAPFEGAGIYAIYYIGDYPAYKFVAERNKDKQFKIPLYVGKAVPAGARKGGFGLGAKPGTVLYSRLAEHADSIADTKLNPEHFFCRFLVVDDIWIPLAEALLIETFAPVWNTMIDGFGNHDPGSGRYNQQKSAWDVLHPGRSWAEKCRTHKKTVEQIHSDLEKYFASTGKRTR